MDPEEVAATEAAACLAGHLPEEAYDRDEVVDAATLGDPGADVSPLRVAADVARLVECTIRDARGRCTFVEGVEGGDAAEALVDAARDDGTRRDDSSGAMAATSIRVPGHDDILSASSSEMFSSSNPSRSSNPAAERLREGMLLATPLVSAVRVARATTEASRVIRWARRNGSDVARGASYWRARFSARSRRASPLFAAEVEGTIVVERVGVFDDEFVRGGGDGAPRLVLARDSCAREGFGWMGVSDIVDTGTSALGRWKPGARTRLRRRRRFPDDASLSFTPVSRLSRKRMSSSPTAPLTKRRTLLVLSQIRSRMPGGRRLSDSMTWRMSLPSTPRSSSTRNSTPRARGRDSDGGHDDCGRRRSEKGGFHQTSVPVEASGLTSPRPRRRRPARSAASRRHSQPRVRERMATCAARSGLSV